MVDGLKANPVYLTCKPIDLIIAEIEFKPMV
jgi:hypothetical protein